MVKGSQDPCYKRLIEALAAARQTAGISQAKLAEMLRKRQQFVSKYESGERRLDAIEVMDICRALGVDAAVLLYDIVPDIRRRAGLLSQP